MYILGTSNFVTPLLGVGVHAGIEVCVIKNDGVCIKNSPNCRAAAVGQDAAEHLPVPVKLLHILLQGHKTKCMNRWDKGQDTFFIYFLCLSQQFVANCFF